MVTVIHERAGFDWARITPGPQAGATTERAASFPISFRGSRLAELQVAPEPRDPAAQAFLERVALLVSAHCVQGGSLYERRP